MIYLVNYIFDLHDIFVGSFIVNRLVLKARDILMQILEEKGEKVNLEQSFEINSLLRTEAIKGSKIIISFESETKMIRNKLASSNLKTKVEGLDELKEVFQ